MSFQTEFSEILRDKYKIPPEVTNEYITKDLFCNCEDLNDYCYKIVVCQKCFIKYAASTIFSYVHYCNKCMCMTYGCVRPRFYSKTLCFKHEVGICSYKSCDKRIDKWRFTYCEDHHYECIHGLCMNISEKGRYYCKEH